MKELLLVELLVLVDEIEIVHDLGHGGDARNGLGQLLLEKRDIRDLEEDIFFDFLGETQAEELSDVKTT